MRNPLECSSLAGGGGDAAWNEAGGRPDSVPPVTEEDQQVSLVLRASHRAVAAWRSSECRFLQQDFVEQRHAPEDWRAVGRCQEAKATSRIALDRLIGRHKDCEGLGASCRRCPTMPFARGKACKGRRGARVPGGQRGCGTDSGGTGLPEHRPTEWWHSIVSIDKTGRGTAPLPTGSDQDSSGPALTMTPNRFGRLGKDPLGGCPKEYGVQQVGRPLVSPGGSR